MRLGWAKTKYSISYFVKKTIYVNGKNKDLVIKRLGSEKQICEKYGVTDAKAWAKEQVRLMNEAEKEDAAKFSIELCAGKDLVMDEQRRFNGGYLFLQDVYYELGLHKICRAISRRHLFEYDLNDVLSRLSFFFRCRFQFISSIAVHNINNRLHSNGKSYRFFNNNIPPCLNPNVPDRRQ